MRRLLTAILPTLLLVVLAGPASAQTPVLDRAAQELRRSPVYVDPAAERAGQVSAERLRERVGRGDGSLSWLSFRPPPGRRPVEAFSSP